MAKRNKSLGSFSAIEAGAARPVIEVAREVSARLRERGVPHALVGGLAVGAYGYERYTRDVDVLIPSDRRDVLKTLSRGAIYPLDFSLSKSPLRGVSYCRRGVQVDVMQPLLRGAFLDADLKIPKAGGAPPVVSAPALVYLKLVSNRAKDRADVVELVKAGIMAGVRHFLDAHAQDLVGRFEELVAQAAAEK